MTIAFSNPTKIKDVRVVFHVDCNKKLNNLNEINYQYLGDLSFEYVNLGRTSKVIPQGGTRVAGCWGPMASSKIAPKTSAILDFTQNQKLSKKNGEN